MGVTLTALKIVVDQFSQLRRLYQREHLLNGPPPHEMDTAELRGAIKQARNQLSYEAKSMPIDRPEYLHLVERLNELEEEYEIRAQSRTRRPS